MKLKTTALFLILTLTCLVACEGKKASSNADSQSSEAPSEAPGENVIREYIESPKDKVNEAADAVEAAHQNIESQLKEFETEGGQ